MHAHCAHKLVLCCEESCKKEDQLLRSLHSQPLVSFRRKYPPKILKNPEVLMLQYQGTFDQRKDGWHSSESRIESTETVKTRIKR